MNSLVSHSSCGQPDQRSPFDSIKQIRPDGSEFWSARELQPMLGYRNWREFNDAIVRAKISCEAVGHKASDHFGDAPKMIDLGKGATRSVPDYHLTRYACYLVAMNGDPRKPEIAAAQTYFAIQTYRQETSASADPSPLLLQNQQLIALCNRQAAIIEQAITLIPGAPKRPRRQMTTADLDDNLNTRYITDRTGWQRDPTTGKLTFVLPGDKNRH